ncbi:MAG: hypothetical protein ACQESR_02520 [Planctomycetota bacterium]
MGYQGGGWLAIGYVPEPGAWLPLASALACRVLVRRGVWACGGLTPLWPRPLSLARDSLVVRGDKHESRQGETGVEPPPPEVSAPDLNTKGRGP